MRPDRLLQWLCRGQIAWGADRSSPQLQTSCCGAGGLLSLLHTDSQAVVATAFAAGLVPATQAWGPGVARSAASPAANQKQRKCQLGRQTAFAAPAVQAPLVKQLAAVFEAGSSSSSSVTGSFSSCRRHSSDSLSPTADADASVLVSVAAAKLESVPSIKGLLQIWESKAQQHLPPSAALSRTSSCASTSSSSSGYSGSSSSRAQPQKRCCLRPPKAAAAPLCAQPTAGAVVAAAAAHAGADADPQSQAAAAEQLQAAGVAPAAGCQASGAAAAAARPPVASSAALVSFMVRGEVSGCLLVSRLVNMCAVLLAMMHPGSPVTP